MDQPDNIQFLFGKLCESYLEQKKACINQPRLSRQQKRNKLQKQLFNTLFTHLKGAFFSCDNGFVEGELRSTPLRLCDHVYNMRLMHNYDDANQLHGLAATCFKGGCDEVKASVLRLLLSLADTSVKERREVTEGHGFSLTSSQRGTLSIQHDTPLLPPGPRNYGDSQIPRRFEDNYFMHFPNEVFTTFVVPAKVETSSLLLDADIFSLTPGTGLPHIFSSKPEKSAYSVKNAGSLFGGLLHSCIQSVDVSLDLPELPQNVDQVTGLTIPKTLLPPADEGYASTNSSSSTPTSELTLDSGRGSTRSADLLDTSSLMAAPQRCLAWETVGRVSLQRELGFVSESGPEAFERLYRLRRQTLALFDPQLGVPAVCKPLTMRQLVQDVIYLLIGVPSHTFLLDTSAQLFSVCPGVRVSGLSLESVAAAVTPLLQCGSHYLRLEDFSQPADMQNINCKGLVFQAFTDSIRRFLQHYRACILTLAADQTLLELQFRMRSVLTQMGFLAELCGCAVTGRPPPAPLQDGHFPTGMRLLSYVYEECLDASNCHHYPMLLSILHCTAKPFLIFLQDWVFYGIHRDLYGEFMVQIDENYLDCRDETYWSRGFRMTADDTVVPLFLKDIAHDVFVCGKSINLLKIIDPQHFLLRMEDEYPSVRISFSEGDLSVLETRCRVYTSRMREIARQQKRTRQEMLAEEVRAKQELAITARHVAAAELERLHEKAEAVRKAQDQKKRKLFTELKTEMEKDLRRRAVDQETERVEDAERVALATKQEVVDARVNEELERQAREELVEEYARLSAQATAREQRALWHVRRSQLAQARIQFMETDQQALQAQLEQAAQQREEAQAGMSDVAVSSLVPEHGTPAPGSSGQALPGWAEEGLQSGHTLHVRGEGRGMWTVQDGDTPAPTPDTSLPAWVSREEGSLKEETQKLHPSQSSIQQVLYTQGKGKDQSHPHIQYATDRPHPSQTSRQGLLQIDGQERGSGPASRQEYVTVEELRKAEDLHRLHTGEEGRGQGAGQHPSMSAIQHLIYPPQEGGKREQPGVQDAINSPHEVTEPLQGATQPVVSATEDIEKPSISSVQDISQQHTANSMEQGPTGEPGEPTIDNTVQDEKAEEVDRALEEEVKKQLQVKLQSHTKCPSYRGQARSQVKVDTQRHATTQSTQELEYKPSVRVQKPTEVTGFSEGLSSEPQAVSKPQIKLVGGSRISSQSEPEGPVKPHVRQVASKGATVESSAESEKRFTKSVAGRHFSQQSQQDDRFNKTGVRRNPGLYANLQSVDKVGIVKKRSLFGHVSELSRGEYQMLAPRVKKQQWHASLESDWFSYQVKCTRRKVAGQSVSARSQEEDTRGHKPQIRVSQDQHVSRESAGTDPDEARLAKFKQQNLRGHASDSTAQRVMYGADYGTGLLTLEEEEAVTEEIRTAAAKDIKFFTDSEIMRFTDNFDMLTASPQVDLKVVNFMTGFGSGLTLSYDLDENTSAHRYVSLPTLLRRSVTTPLLAQTSLVNESLLSLYHTDLLIDRHFEALRRFMLMQDGEFAHSLTHQLFDKLSQNPSVVEMFNPVFLTSTLQTALRASLQGDDQYAANLSFVLKKVPALLKPNSSDALEGLELTYKVEWPLNIVISDSCLCVYGRLFSFMLLLKRAVWSLKDVWTRLKRDAVVGKAARGPQYTRLQLIRHEMQHFAQAMQGYISHQVVHVAWREFVEQLDTDVHSVDALHNKHAAYLYNCQARCLLNKKAHKVMQVIESIFSLILKLQVQLLAGSWYRSEDSGQMEHPHYEQMCQTYKSFSEHSRFLYKVVNKIAMRGYKPYLQELINRLNFNGYYQADHATQAY